MIGLRFLLKLLAANPNNIFAQLVYFFTSPFLAIFVGLTNTPSFQGIVIEFHDLIAIMVYFILSWVVVRLLWILPAKLKPN
jgi:YggT family protein